MPEKEAWGPFLCPSVVSDQPLTGDTYSSLLPLACPWPFSLPAGAVGSPETGWSWCFAPWKVTSVEAGTHRPFYPLLDSHRTQLVLATVNP